MKHTFIFLSCIAMVSCSPDSHTVKPLYQTIMGSKIYYEESGSGIPLMILSGGGIDRSTRDFDACIPLLSKNFRLIVPDSPGQGKSEQPDTLTYSLLSSYFFQLIDSLHLDSVYVIGWSDGAIASLLLASEHPDRVKKVIAVGANNGLSGNALPAGIDEATVVPQSSDAWAKANQQSVEHYSKEIKRDWKKMMNSFNAMWYQSKYFSDSILPNIRIPVMLAQGDHDFINIDHAVSLHRMIPNSQLCILPGTSHEVFRERPALISKVATDFFK